MGFGDESGISTIQFLEKKNILITGGTGFLSKIFLEKILRLQPNVGKIYLLIRAPDSPSVAIRFQNEVITKDLFRILKGKYGENFDSFISEKVVPVAGDISYQNLGVEDIKIREEMWRDLNIIINFAATTNFDERYDVAMGINTWGPLNVLNFAKKCHGLKTLVHVSTAYVCGEKAGVIEEKPFYMGETLNGGKSKLDIATESKMAEEKVTELRALEPTEKAVTSAMKDFGIKRARHHGWPNTYVFTKAMGEMLLGKFKEDVPLVILRPTIITSTYKEPFPGWIEGLRTIDSIIAGCAKGKIKFMPFNPQLIFDAMPADMVVNSIIVASVPDANDSMALASRDRTVIYHIGSSSKNPITFTNLQAYGLRYISKHPLMDKHGKPIKVHKVFPFSTMSTFMLFMTVRFLLPLKVLQLLSLIFPRYFKDLYSEYDRKIKFVMRLIDLYESYLFFKGIFDDTNAERLRMVSRKKGEGDVFNFDPKCIDWEDYFTYTHIAGLVKYVIR